MGKLSQHIRIRISGSQLKLLAQAIIKEQRTKSQLLRDAINQYLVENSIMDKSLNYNEKQTNEDKKT